MTINTRDAPRAWPQCWGSNLPLPLLTPGRSHSSGKMATSLVPPGSGSGPFGPVPVVCRAGVREEELIRILANGYTLDLSHRNWAPPQLAFACLYLFPFLCSSFRYRPQLLWVKKPPFLRTKRDRGLFSACAWVTPVGTNRALCTVRRISSQSNANCALSYLKNKLFFFLHWVN